MAPTVASYFAVVGEGTAWPHEKCVAIRDVKDGTSNTLVCVEVRNSGVHWLEPSDVNFQELREDAFGKMFEPAHIWSDDYFWQPDLKLPGSVLYLDGHAGIIPTSTPPDIVEGLLTIDGGGDVTDPRY